MRSSVRRALVVGAVVAIQAIAVGLYLRIDRARRPSAGFTFTTLPGSPAPPLVVQRPDGREQDVAGAGRVRVIHFWATWCAPCRKELPELLARAAEVRDLELFAVSIDDDWRAVRDFFPSEVPTPIVKVKEREAHRQYGAHTLPDTYVLSSDGRLVERIVGARDWSMSEAREYLRTLPSRIR